VVRDLLCCAMSGVSSGGGGQRQRGTEGGEMGLCSRIARPLKRCTRLKGKGRTSDDLSGPRSSPPYWRASTGWEST
jgi:hypothetical protein